jgi:hypothetical protein
MIMIPSIPDHEREVFMYPERASVGSEGCRYEMEGDRDSRGGWGEYSTI